VSERAVADRIEPPPLRMRRILADRVHRQISRSRTLSQAYLSSLSFVCRNLAPATFTDKAAAVVSRPYWPKIQFRPRRVTVGLNTELWITPHIGSLTWEALFQRRLSYERPVFSWLETAAIDHYDAVVEIGANVGLYTVFLRVLTQRAGNHRLRRVISFEPSATAFAQLAENLACNGLTAADAFPLAVAAQSGFQTLYEPAGHLTNGSLVEDFARIFSSTVTKTAVFAVTPDQLEDLLREHERVLFKIDVEGYEPKLLPAFAGLVARRRPDFLIEVLDGAADLLEAIGFLAGYERFLIEDGGPARHDHLFADPAHRDWLLRAPEGV
jgi:FkbM family methyltransferase